MNTEFSMLETYGECLTDRDYITNPAIAREEEIKQIILILHHYLDLMQLMGKMKIDLI